MKKTKLTVQKIEELIILTKNKVKLLEELKNSVLIELCSFELAKQPDRNKGYFLINLYTKGIIKTGTPEQIKRFMRLRKIEPDIVYNYELINK